MQTYSAKPRVPTQQREQALGSNSGPPSESYKVTPKEQEGPRNGPASQGLPPSWAPESPVIEWIKVFSGLSQSKSKSFKQKERVPGGNPEMQEDTRSNVHGDPQKLILTIQYNNPSLKGLNICKIKAHTTLA